jgi:hypothetical protein
MRAPFNFEVLLGVSAAALLSILLATAGIVFVPCFAQSPSRSQRSQSPLSAAGSNSNAAPVPLESNWGPPAWIQLSDLAVSRSSFTLDRANPEDNEKLEEAQNLVAFASKDQLEEAQARTAIGMVDSVRIQALNFGPNGAPDGTMVDQIRQAYGQQYRHHHIWFNAPSCGTVNNTTDIWWPGEPGFQSAVLFAESRHELVLVSVTGRFETSGDVLHLRGHIGIPRFDACAVTSREKYRPALSPE